VSRQRRLVLTAASLSLVVALAGAACGGKSADEKAASASTSKKKDAAAASGDAKAGDAGATADASAAGKKAPATTTAGSKSGGAAASKGATAGAGATTSSLDLSAFEGDYVFGAPHGQSNDDPRPPNCNFTYGQLCRMQITGTYQLKTGDVASIQVGAYEDGATEPAFHTELPGAKKGSAHWHIDQFPYQAREGVKEMAILVKMFDPKGKELARGKPTVFPIALFNKK
jgi:hypothetical protein